MILSYDGSKTYFSDKELACQGTGVLKLDPVFETQLRTLRSLYGAPMYLTSVCRSPSHNKAVGGHPRSLHLTKNPVHPTKGCMAADVSIVRMTEEEKTSFKKLAWSLGWSIGVASTFFHIDRRIDIGLKQFTYNY